MLRGRWLALPLLLHACGGATRDRRPMDEPQPANDEALQPDEPSGAVSNGAGSSGAAPYVPPVLRVPEGSIDRALLERALAAGPGWLLSEVPLQPTFLGKHKFNGFKIMSLFRNNPKVLRYGIAPGDLLRSVNGQKIVTPGDLLLVFERLKTADTLDVSVERAGADLQFRFPIVPALGLPAFAPPPVDATPGMAR